MSGAGPENRDQELHELLVEYFLQQEEGRELSSSEHLARHPELAEELAFLLNEGSLPGRQAGEELPRVLGSYEILEHVATGGGGTVFKARHLTDGRVVALKLLHASALSMAEELEDFQREASFLRDLNLVNVIPIFEAGEEQGHLFLAMKWIDGCTLQKFLAEQQGQGRATPDFRTSARLVACVARTLGIVHKSGILHRDIKPSNILVDASGEPVLIDFGIARRPREMAREPGQRPEGTPRYLAPELLDERHGGHFSPRSEIYSLGLCLYECLSGQPAFQEKKREELFRRIRERGVPDPSRHCPRLPAPLKAIILRACAREPRRRYGSMEAFANDLDRFVAGEAPARATLSLARPWRRFVIRHGPRRILVGLMAGILLCVWGVHAVRMALRERELARWERLLEPYAFASSECLPPDAGPLEQTATRLARLAPRTLQRRFLCAWVPYLRGHHEVALENLGPSKGGDVPELRLFRRYLKLLIGNFMATGKHSRLPVHILPPGGGGGQGSRESLVVEGMRPVKVTGELTGGRVVGETLEGGELSHLWRQRPLAPKQVRRLIRSFGASLQGPLAAMLQVHMRFVSLPCDLTRKEARPALIRMLPLCKQALKGGFFWAAYIRGALQLLYGDASQALLSLARLDREHPGWMAVEYLHAVALSRTGSQGALALFSKLASRSQGSFKVPGQFHGWWAQTALEGGAFDKLPSILARWRLASGQRSWQDQVLPLLMEARGAELEGHKARALALLKRASSMRPQYALPRREEARILRSLREPEEAARMTRAADRAGQQWPGDLTSWLSFNVFGLRPHANKQNFATRFFEAVRSQPERR